MADGCDVTRVVITKCSHVRDGYWQMADGWNVPTAHSHRPRCRIAVYHPAQQRKGKQNVSQKGGEMQKCRNVADGETQRHTQHEAPGSAAGKMHYGPVKHVKKRQGRSRRCGGTAIALSRRESREGRTRTPSRQASGQ